MSRRSEAPHAAPKRIRLRQDDGPALKVLAIGQHRVIRDDLYHFILTRPWWQFLGLFILLFVFLNALFAVGYVLAPGSIANARPHSFEDAFFFSVQTLATIGYGGMAPASLMGHLLVTVEAITGMIGVALTTGITYAKFSRPTARVLFSRAAGISTRDGVPHLMFRLANWRRNQIYHATLRAYLLISDVTLEGERMRRVHDLSLVRDNNPTFILTWTAMHRIDETSPFFGDHAFERLRKGDTQLIVMVTGTDETLSQQVYARHAYNLDDILPNARFVDMVDVLPDGTRVIDYSKIHDMFEAGPGAEGA